MTITRVKTAENTCLRSMDWWMINSCTESDTTNKRSSRPIVMICRLNTKIGLTKGRLSTNLVLVMRWESTRTCVETNTFFKWRPRRFKEMYRFSPPTEIVKLKINWTWAKGKKMGRYFRMWATERRQMGWRGTDPQRDNLVSFVHQRWTHEHGGGGESRKTRRRGKHTDGELHRWRQLEDYVSCNENIVFC